jgi:hypothetical protein
LSAEFIHDGLYKSKKTLTIAYSSILLRLVHAICTEEIAMSHASAGLQATEHDRHLHAQLSAFNSAFAELGLRFRWDADTLYTLAPIEGEAARLATYIRTHHSHLLKAYSIDFLCEAILGRKNAQAPGEWLPGHGTLRNGGKEAPLGAPQAGWEWSEPGLPALAGA